MVYRILLISLCCLLPALPSWARHDEADDKSHGDSTLSLLNKQLQDSMEAPGFVRLQKQAMRRAVKAGNEYYCNLFRRSLVTHYSARREVDNFVRACDELIARYKEGNGADREHDLYDLWSLKFDRLQMWGRHDEALAVVRQMADYAQQQGDELGVAVANFCFGHIYLDNRQCEEAEKYYRMAYGELLRRKEYDRALRVCFNLMAMQMNMNEPEKGLAISDSAARLIWQWQGEGKEIPPVTLMKQALYRFRLFYRSNRFPEAEAQRDTMLRYYRLHPDPSQDEAVRYAIICFDRARGNYREACAGLDTLIERSLRQRDFLKVARYRYTLADTQRQMGDLEAAIASYRQYAVDNDSANIYATSRQLNELTKQFQLNEMAQREQLARTRAWSFGICLALLVICAGLVIHLRRLRRKNVELALRIRRQMHAEVRAEALEAAVPEETLNKDQLRFRRIRELLADRKILADPDLNHDKLAQLLHTNRKYVADAVAAGTEGRMNVSRYINLQRSIYACELFETHPELTMNEVQERVGFSSAGNFYTMFKNHYGMTPGKYKEYLKEKMTDNILEKQY